MKRRTPHLVFLSRQALDIFIALKTFAGGSEYVLASRYDSDLPMSAATLNRVPLDVMSHILAGHIDVSICQKCEGYDRVAAPVYPALAALVRPCTLSPVSRIVRSSTRYWLTS